MRTTVLILALILSSCARQSFSGNEPSDEIRQYVDEFVSLYGQPMPEILYVFSELDGKSAECIKGSNGARTININSLVFSDYCEARQRAIVFHELGHCVLNRSHTEEISYMRAALMSCEFYELYRQEIDEELFINLNLSPAEAVLKSEHETCDFHSSTNRLLNNNTRSNATVL